MHRGSLTFSRIMIRRYKCMITRIVIILTVCGLISFLILFDTVGTGDETEPNLTPDKLKKLLDEANAENTWRSLTIDKTCERYNLGIYKNSNENHSPFKHPPAPQYSVLYIDKIHNLSYCPIYKAGSTTWLYNLCLLMNVSENDLTSSKEQISTVARRVLPELEIPDAEQALKTTSKLLVVRHPFERLLSAYRDKLENSVAGREHGTLHFYQKYGEKIVKKYRDKNFPTPRTDQFIQRRGVPGPAGIEPTWREFVEYLINTDLANYGDDHWMPYYLFCTPCLVKYDIVAKVETLWRDQIFAIHKLGLQKKIKPRWRHSGGHSNASKIYFNQLSRDTVRRLYEKFKLDFELFDYSHDEYYKYAMQEEF
ncbi:carbohydrate sulfotransferase 11 isoform X2 [Cephus cinctus]|uniref:Carbohydrate sulfotransferase n=1 Tax=Cephus cinctus TaxID=211228 RepID=A0AAJ7C3M1_CEPCN|nr:carbohydrate sulfotransferase 11 isoform X2 [Cephus cinctus]